MTDPIMIHAHVPTVSLTHAFHVYTTPADICLWNAASDDWHTPSASIDLRPGGRLLSRMEARDGSMGFDFGATISVVDAPHCLAYTIDDGRAVDITFVEANGGVDVTIAFEAEGIHPREMQQQGWQAILDRFAAHAAETATS
jgi:uncharacterized protein YndB with AHSA1/START domain